MYDKLISLHCLKIFLCVNNRVVNLLLRSLANQQRFKWNKNFLQNLANVNPAEGVNCDHGHFFHSLLCRVLSKSYLEFY